MAEIVKSAGGASLATPTPSTNHMIGPDLIAGEDIQAADACYIMNTAAGSRVMRALEDQTGTTAAVNDVQTMSQPEQPNGLANDGSYTLSYLGAFTAPLTVANTNADVQTAITGLATTGAGTWTVSGNFPNFVFTAAGSFAGKELEQIGVQSSLFNTAQPSTILPLQITHTTVGQPVGASGAEQKQSRVRGWAPIKVRKGNPITLYDAVIFGYSDQLLVPGTDYYLSSTVPGGITDTSTLTGQKPIAMAMDSERLYVFAIN
jgi:hypothetical protein